MAFTSRFTMGQYPSDALPNQAEQSIIKTKGTAITYHTATGMEVGCGTYAPASDLVLSSSIEEGELLARYELGPCSTMDGDPTVVFRSFAGMPASIRVVWAGVANTDYRPNLTSSDKINATSGMDITVAGYCTTIYTANEVGSKWSMVFVRQMSHTEDPYPSPRRSRYNKPEEIYTLRMVLASNLHFHGYDASDRLAQLLRESINRLMEDDDATVPDARTATEKLKYAVETNIPNDSGLRTLLIKAGVPMQKFQTDQVGGDLDGTLRSIPSLAEPPAVGANLELIGQNLVYQFDATMSQLYMESKRMDEPACCLEEGIKILAYLFDFLNELPNNRLDEMFRHKKWALQSHLTIDFCRFFGYCLEDDMYNRQYQLFGRLMKTATPDELDIPFVLNN